MASLVQVLSSVKGTQRVLVVALILIPLLLVTIGSLPAVAVLPFLPGGVDRVQKLVGGLVAWTRIILKGVGA